MDKQKYKLDVMGIVILENIIKSLESESKIADDMKDNGAYNRIIALKLNIREFLAYFEKRNKE